MTYSGFLVRFVFIPICLLLGLLIWFRRKHETAGFQFAAFWRITLLHVFLALLYTTPWDNYLVYSKVWSYNPALVTGVVFGWVPLEEYIFFVAETVLCTLWWYFLASLLPPVVEPFTPSRKIITWSSAVLVLSWLFFTALFFTGWKPSTYISITLFWALPAVLPQLLFGADILWYHRRLVIWAFLPVGVYLSLADMVAIKSTTWSISPAQITGILFFQILPVEEVLFFFVTNILISFGMTLMLSRLSQVRLENWRQRGFHGLPGQ